MSKSKSKSKSLEEEQEEDSPISPASQGSSRSKSSSPKSSKTSSPKSSKSRSSSGSKSATATKSSPKSSPDINHMQECEIFIRVVSEVLARPNDISASIYSTMSEDIKKTWNDYSISINIWNKHTGKSCAYIKYSAIEKIIHIVEIERCNDKMLPDQGKGSDIIKQLIAVGDRFSHHLNPGTQLKIMVDDDASMLYVKKVEYELKWIYIFATGESWYNSLGFKEAEYEANSDIVRQFIGRAYDDDVDKTIGAHFARIKRELRDPEIPIEKLKEYKSDLVDTVKEFKRFERIMIRDGFYKPGLFHTKFENIIYEYPVSGVGFGKKKNKSKTKMKMKTIKNKSRNRNRSRNKKNKIIK